MYVYVLLVDAQLINTVNIITGNVDIYYLISTSVIVSFNELTRILKMISQCNVEHIMTLQFLASDLKYLLTSTLAI